MYEEVKAEFPTIQEAWVEIVNLRKRLWEEL